MIRLFGSRSQRRERLRRGKGAWEVGFSLQRSRKAGSGSAKGFFAIGELADRDAAAYNMGAGAALSGVVPPFDEQTECLGLMSYVNAVPKPQ